MKSEHQDGKTEPAATLRDFGIDNPPFNLSDSQNKVHQLFGEQLPKLLDEPNEVLAA